MRTKRNALIEMLIITLAGSLIALIQTLWLKSQIANSIEKAARNVINNTGKNSNV
jgi:cellobiose-specific phosphotransferase system component IIC